MKEIISAPDSNGYRYSCNSNDVGADFNSRVENNIWQAGLNQFSRSTNRNEVYDILKRKMDLHVRDVWLRDEVETSVFQHVFTYF